MPPKTVALIAAVCLISGWLLASVLMPPTANLQALPDRRPPERVVAEPMPPAYSEQLKLRLERLPAAPVPRRNPFVFGSRERVATTSPRAAGRDEPEAAVVLPPEPVAPAGPIFALSGMAIRETPDGPVRTAVLSDGQIPSSRLRTTASRSPIRQARKACFGCADTADPAGSGRLRRSRLSRPTPSESPARS
jgi:hypothetical protein